MEVWIYSFSKTIAALLRALPRGSIGSGRRLKNSKNPVQMGGKSFCKWAPFFTGRKNPDLVLNWCTYTFRAAPYCTISGEIGLRSFISCSATAQFKKKS